MRHRPLPMQPVTMTLPFSLMASPIASRDSCFALSMKPQVFTHDDIRILVGGDDVVPVYLELGKDALRNQPVPWGQPRDTKPTRLFTLLETVLRHELQLGGSAILAVLVLALAPEVFSPQVDA